MNSATKLLDLNELKLKNDYWKAANYLSVGQIYLLDNALLREPLKIEHIKQRLLGHWGTTPGLNFVYAHLNRLIKKHDLNIIYLCGSGHGGLGIVANTYLEGSYSEGYSCLMVAYFDSGQGAVVMTNSDNGDALAEEIMRSIAKEYGWFEYLPKEKIIVSVERKIYDSYAGQYEIAPNYFLNITNENGKLFSQMTGQAKSELFAESETNYFLKESETEIKFVKNIQGAVTGLVWRERNRDTFVQKIK